MLNGLWGTSAAATLRRTVEQDTARSGKASSHLKYLPYIEHTYNYIYHLLLYHRTTHSQSQRDDAPGPGGGGASRRALGRRRAHRSVTAGLVAFGARRRRAIG